MSASWNVQKCVLVDLVLTVGGADDMFRWLIERFESAPTPIPEGVLDLSSALCEALERT